MDTIVFVEISEGFFRIENSGVPIPGEKLPKIFERFTRADESRGGFGIGLHLVAQIARRYGIRVDAESAGRRTVFRLTWSR
jgi:signal transduction histidine kinase